MGDNAISLDINFLSQLIFEKEGDLMILFRETNGFHIQDEDGHTPLYYACSDGLDDVIDFYTKYIFKNKMQTKQSEEEDEKDEASEDSNVWVWDQNYLHNLLNALFVTNASNPNPKSFDKLLSTGSISINFNCPKQGYL